MNLSGATFDSIRLNHLPLVREAFDELGILSVVEEALPKHEDAKTSDADCLLVMGLNVLQGRCALYRMGEWLARLDADVLVGEDCPCEAFSDTRLGQALDRFYNFGLDNLFSRIAQHVLKTSIPSSTAPSLFRADTTSLVLHGIYDGETDSIGPTPAHGYSKDHRPDLKQLMMSLCLDNHNRPVAFQPLDGNTAEQTANRDLLDHVANNIIPPQGATWVGDAKLVDPDTIGQLRANGFHFVSLLPKTYSLRTHLINTIDDDKMVVVADKPPTKAGGERRSWRAISAHHAFPMRASPDAQEEHENLRFVVIHSSQLEEKFLKSLDKKLEKEEAALRRAIPKKAFACRADAEAAFDTIRKKEKYLVAELEVVEEQERIKRTRRGRPRKGEVREKTVYRVHLSGVFDNDDLIATACRQASHFVLVTDHIDEQAWSDQKVFDTYQGQQAIEGKTGFRWLKSAHVAPVLLKNPSRIAALMFVFVVSLMVRNHIESRVRARLAELGEEIRYYTRTRTTNRPTAEVIFDCFDAVSIVRIKSSDGPPQRALANLDQYAQHVLDILGWSKNIFTAIRKRPSQHTEGL